MKPRVLMTIVMSAALLSAAAQRVSLHVKDEPAAEVFRSLMSQTGKNFVYSSDLLKDMKVTVDADNQPLKRVLGRIFTGTGIKYNIKGDNVTLIRVRAADKEQGKAQMAQPQVFMASMPDDSVTMLDELVVMSRLGVPTVESGEIGAKKLTPEDVRATPVLFGEADVVKTLHTQPGVVEGVEGLAGMYVHGGNADENMYMLDNVPLYQVNHFAGLFSAFNTDLIRYIDFFKSSIPAKYDGRLSSFMDVRTVSGDSGGLHGSARLGLTSGSFSLNGPIGKKTSFLVGLRRSWFDVLTIPFLAIANSANRDEKMRFNYYFMDFNARISHQLSSKANAFVSFYYGDDNLKTGAKDKGLDLDDSRGLFSDERYDMHWGNLLAQAGLNYRFGDRLSSEWSAAYTRYFSDMSHSGSTIDKLPGQTTTARSVTDTDNNINDWIFRGDFDWTPLEGKRVRFGAGYTRHSFLPSMTSRRYEAGDSQLATRDSSWTYGANECNVYIEDDWNVSTNVRMNVGLHASLFNIDGRTDCSIDPRLSVSWRPAGQWAVKGAYARTSQYVHQLSQSYLSLPVDQWMPVTGSFKPESADKVALGAYWQSRSGAFTVSVEAYWKWMHHLIDYKDEYYLRPPLEMWDAELCSGSGSAKGIDIMIEKVVGRLAGHVAYSLAWADRTFPLKNGGATFPAKFDNRHTVNISLTWKVSDKVDLSAQWVGHSGNRFTLLSQVWQSPDFDGNDWWWDEDSPLREPINNYRLPFYHRLDLSCSVRNRRGYWTFGLYNAYCHVNTVAILCGTRDIEVSTPDEYYIKTEPAFKKVKLLPVIPSISYTWLF